jgi:hypothetical protein
MPYPLFKGGRRRYREIVTNIPMTASAPMYPDASYAAPLLTDAEFDAYRWREVACSPAPRSAGLGWRHFVTALLLLLTLPVFALAALACLPVLLVVGGGEGLRKLLPALRR